MTNSVANQATNSEADTAGTAVRGPGFGTTVLVRYFAGARAAAGVAEENITLTDGDRDVATTLAVVRDRRGPELDRVLTACSFLLNGVAVRDQAQTVPDGAELDILPPFAGG